MKFSNKAGTAVTTTILTISSVYLHECCYGFTSIAKAAITTIGSTPAPRIRIHDVMNNRCLTTCTYTNACANNFGIRTTSSLRMTIMTNNDSDNDDDDADNNNNSAGEIERLRSMAAQLRAEAAQLESDQAQELAGRAQRLFDEFDTNGDGEISMEELKVGLEKKLKTKLPEDRIAMLMKSFDYSGDGALQIDEFVTVERFRNKLDALAREEKEMAAEAVKQAQVEEEKARIEAFKLEMLNDAPPTTTDKLISILPYLFPLMDGLQYGRFLILDIENTTNGDNPVLLGLAVLYTLYRSIPFSGFLAFFAINSLSANTRINRLIRFNLQQSIFVDLALFFPGLLTGIGAVALSTLGVSVPSNFSEIGADAVFYVLLATLAYCSISSLIGIAPDKIPIVSQAVLDRIPDVDWFDEEGRLIPRGMRDPSETDEQEDKGKDNDK